MEQRVNEGYVITDSVHIGNAEFVIGQNETKYGTMYVTWRCSNGTNYHWGIILRTVLPHRRTLWRGHRRKFSIWK